MSKAGIPPQESKRLEALNALDILYVPLEERFDRITRTLCRLFDVPLSYLSLIDEDTQWFKSIQGAPLINTPRQESLCQHTLLTSDHLICPDLTQDQRFCDSVFVTGDLRARFYAGVLLKSQGQNIGTLCLIDNKPRNFAQNDLSALLDIMAWAQTELNFTQLTDTQIELLGELDHALQAERADSLTRLWNQNTIRHILHRAFHRHLLNLTPLSVLLIDIDHFSRVNEHYGHPAGDKVLQTVASALRQCLRPDDATGRDDGDKFMVVLDNCSPNQAERLARRILHKIHGLSFEHLFPGLTITASIGIAGSDSRGLEHESELIELAGQALEEARQAGNGCICIRYEEDVPPA